MCVSRFPMLHPTDVLCDCIIIVKRTIPVGATETETPYTPDAVSFVFTSSDKTKPDFEEVFTENLMLRKDVIMDKMVSTYIMSSRLRPANDVAYSSASLLTFFSPFSYGRKST